MSFADDLLCTALKQPPSSPAILTATTVRIGRERVEMHFGRVREFAENSAQFQTLGCHLDRLWMPVEF